MRLIIILLLLTNAAHAEDNEPKRIVTCADFSFTGKPIPLDKCEHVQTDLVYTDWEKQFAETEKEKRTQETTKSGR